MGKGSVWHDRSRWPIRVYDSNARRMVRSCIPAVIIGRVANRRAYHADVGPVGPVGSAVGRVSRGLCRAAIVFI